MTEHSQIQEYTQTAAAIAMLRQKYGNVAFDVATTKGMDAARQARAEVKGYRVALEKLRVELKAPALERTRLIDAEAKRITAELLAIEEPIDQQIKVEEQRKEEEKAAKARAEAARLAAIAARVSAIRNRVAEVANKPAEVIRAAMEQAQTLEVAPEAFQEFMPDAIAALDETRQALQTALNARMDYELEQARIKEVQEAEAARLQAEREELERLQAAEAARQAEEARKAEEARQAEAARLQAERERQDAELRARRDAQEQAEREARQARAAEEARLRAEREAMERQRAELDARQRALEEQAKVAKLPRKSKIADPVADLKQAVNANAETAKALDDAYQRGYQAGLTAARHVA